MSALLLPPRCLFQLVPASSCGVVRHGLSLDPVVITNDDSSPLSWLALFLKYLGWQWYSNSVLQVLVSSNGARHKPRLCHQNLDVWPKLLVPGHNLRWHSFHRGPFPMIGLYSPCHVCLFPCRVQLARFSVRIVFRCAGCCP